MSFMFRIIPKFLLVF